MDNIFRYKLLFSKEFVYIDLGLLLVNICDRIFNIFGTILQEGIGKRFRFFIEVKCLSIPGGWCGYQKNGLLFC